MLRTSVLVIAVLIAGGWVAAAHAQSQATADQEERRVQAAVLDSFFTRSDTKVLILLDSTVRGSDHFVDEDYASALRTLGELPDGLHEDFENKRKHRVGLREISARVPIVLIGARELAEIQSGATNPDSYWRRFYARFPASSGRLAVSRVGFSRDGRYALILVDYGCGGRCGGTVYYLLEKRTNRWVTIRLAQPRIS